MNKPAWYQGLGIKLAASFFLGVIFVSLLLVYAERTLNQTVRDSEQLLQQELVPLALANKLQSLLLQLRELETGLRQTRDHFALVSQVDDLRQAITSFDEQLTPWLLILDQQEGLRRRQVEENWQGYSQDLQEIAKAAEQGQYDQLMALSIYQSTSRYQALVRYFQVFAQERQDSAEHIYHQQVDRKQQRFKYFLVASGVALLLLGSLLGVFILRLLRRIILLRNGAQGLARDGLMNALEVRGKDELAQLTMAFNQMQTKILAREQALNRSKENLELRVSERTQELRESNAELEQFAYVASHDLRQPLRMINSYLQMLERRLEGQLDEDNKLMMDFATDGAKRLDQMLVSLLEYSRVGRKGQPMETLASREAVDEALHFLQPQITENQARVQVAGNDWPYVLASRDELTRLFQNLVSNAVKYHPPGETPEVTLQVSAENERFWLFSVADRGIGIDPDQADRLFKVFQRLQTRDKFAGNGVGLAICRKIVERHGGKIWMESAGEGQGSCFYFTLPTLNSSLTRGQKNA
ncbi:ATP-binding protein [Marinospirillum sp.]|uniref:sensor histidine kinase n=1 Tax=Marinospirillum sp. TaxID=2183934 RepID=UPI00384D9F44